MSDNNAWKYKSIEQAELEKEAGIWKFKTVTHTGIATDGTIPPCVNFSCNITSAMSSISANRTRARMDIQFNISFNVNCCPWCNPSNTNSNAHSEWNAQ